MFVYRWLRFERCNCFHSFKTTCSQPKRNGDIEPGPDPSDLLPNVKPFNCRRYQRPTSITTGIHMDSDFVFEYGYVEDDICPLCEWDLKQAVQSMIKDWWGQRLWSDGSKEEPEGWTPATP